MEYIISALWLALECVAFFLFASAFLPYRHNSKRTLLTALSICILFLLNQSLTLPALMRRLCALTFGLCLIAFLFQGRLEQRIFIGLLDYILIAAMDAIVLFGASTVLRISLDELVWKKELAASRHMARLTVLILDMALILSLSTKFYAFASGIVLGLGFTAFLLIVAHGKQKFEKGDM